MNPELAKKISDKIATLPEDEQEMVLEYIESRIELRSRTERDERPIWEVLTEMSDAIPLEEWEKLPSDGSVNHDHYLYGAPKRY
jgi:hypothetical protein